MVLIIYGKRKIFYSLIDAVVQFNSRQIMSTLIDALQIFQSKFHFKFWCHMYIRPTLKITFLSFKRLVYLLNYQYINTKRILQFFSLKSLQDPISRRHIYSFRRSFRHSFFYMDLSLSEDVISNVILQTL